jgi:hypothetical protein
VHRADVQVGRLVQAINRRPALKRDLVLILTADHGGVRSGHYDPTRLGNYRVPFLVWGAGVDQADLYELNPGYADPGSRRTGYGAERQPVRNGDVANLALDLLGLPAVKDSEHDAEQDLDVTG